MFKRMVHTFTGVKEREGNCRHTLCMYTDYHTHHTNPIKPHPGLVLCLTEALHAISQATETTTESRSVLHAITEQEEDGDHDVRDMILMKTSI
jgi:hypothetical protein